MKKERTKKYYDTYVILIEPSNSYKKAMPPKP
jgi:hypothetical protein